MCGIAASLGLPSSVEALVGALRHRGPDASGVVRGADFAIGATRLRVNGGEQSDMPLVSTSGRTIVVVNGEVFNHGELYASPPGTSDLHGLPDLLERDGPAVFARLRGPFAIAVVDRDAGSLLLARDEIGIRPLFVSESGSAIVAASEVLPLRDVLGLRELDHDALAHLLAFQFWPKDGTPWRGLKPITPGSWCRYRRLERGGWFREEGRFRFEGGEGSLPEALQAAFRIQGQVSKKSAVTLSGGLDSSAVLALLHAAEATPDLAAVGWFPQAGAAFDERRHARAVARELGVPLLEVPITAAAYAKAWPKVIRALGGPLAGPGAPSQWILAEALAQEGVRVVFSGQGGDELFGGYERTRLLQQIEAGVPAQPAAGYEGLVPRQGDDVLHHLYFRGRSLLPFFEPDRRAAVLAALDVLPKAGPGLADRTQAFEFETLLPGLLAVDDRSFAAFGIEGRVPLLDPVIARIARAIPLGSKSPPGAPRRLFRELLGTQLPAAASARGDKMGFPVPLESWFEHALKPHLAELLEAPSLARAGFRPKAFLAPAAARLSARTLYFLGSLASLLAADAEVGVAAAAR